MRNAMLKPMLVAGLVFLTGNARANKTIEWLTVPAVVNGSTEGAIGAQDVKDAVLEVCRVWNTPAMTSTLDPAFPDTAAFIASFGLLPKDATLVLTELVTYSVSARDVVAVVEVAVRRPGVTQPDTPRRVTWTFKRY